MKRHEHPNAKRWLKPPTIEQIDAVVKASGASEPMFESYHGIYIGCIIHVRMGFRNMPLKHWHLFLEDNPKNTNKHTNKPVISKPKKQKVSADSRLAGLV